MIKKLVKFVLKLSAVLFVIYVLSLNYALYYNPDFIKKDGYFLNQGVYNQLQFIKQEIKSGAATEMQGYFPEGYIFLNALYGLSWKETIKYLPKDAPEFEEGIDEINWSWNQINSAEGKSIFPKSLALKYGAFYAGWNNYVLASKLEIEAPEERNLEQIKTFKASCERIARAIDKIEFPYLESYQGSSWPADNFVAIASLKLHDNIFEPQYTLVIQDWITKVKDHLDPRTQLIPHYVNSEERRIIQGARGSSQSLTLNFLYEIDQEFAETQFVIYKKLFLDKRLGLYGIREYPKGTNGYGDIDSGPVIWGIGGSASIVGQRTLWKFKNTDESVIIRNSIEAFGIPTTFSTKKKYLFGELVMADAFIAWSNSIEQQTVEVDLKYWRLRFQLISLVLILICAYLYKQVN